jgi:hypothetical protein
MWDMGDHDPAFWLELSPEVVPYLLRSHPELLEWRSPKGLNFAEHLLLWPGPFPGKYTVVEALLAAHPAWDLRAEVIDEAVRFLALSQDQSQWDPFTETWVYDPGEGRPVEPEETDGMASRFAISLKAAEPTVRSRRLQRMGRVLQLHPKTGGPFHAQLRRALKAKNLLSAAQSYAADPKPAFNVPQRPVPLRRPAPRAKYEASLMAGRPMTAAKQVWGLRMSKEALGKMLADLIRRRLGSARYLRRRGGLKTRWQARSARKMEYVDFRKFLQALAISAPDAALAGAVLLPSLQCLMEEAMLEDDMDLFKSLYPNQKPADVTHRLTKRALKLARQFSPVAPLALAGLARNPLGYPSRYASVVRTGLRTHLQWDENHHAPVPAPAVMHELDLKNSLANRRRAPAAPAARAGWKPPAPPKPSVF